MAFNREKFFSQYRVTFGRLNQQQVDGLSFLLKRLEQDARLKVLGFIELCAYILATAKHESGHTYQPVREGGSEAYFVTRYWLNKKVRTSLGNLSKADAVKFIGHGLVQVTGRKNFTLIKSKLGIDCVKSPEQLLEPNNAYEALVRGMLDGWYGPSVKKFIKPGSPPDFVGARYSVNVQDQANHIADTARRFLEILRHASS